MLTEPSSLRLRLPPLPILVPNRAENVIVVVKLRQAEPAGSSVMFAGVLLQ